MKSFTYHTLDVQDGGGRVNVPLSGQCAGWESLPEGPLKLLDMILDVAIRRGNVHKLVRIHLPEPLDVHRPALTVDTVVALRVVAQHVIQFFELEILKT